MEENNDSNDDMELNEQQHVDRESFPVPVSSTSSLDSFCLATADLMQECNDGGDDELHYNAAMDIQSTSHVEMSTGNHSSESASLTINTTTTTRTTEPNMLSSSVISPGAGGVQTMRAVLPPSMSLPLQQQQQLATTNQYQPLAAAPMSMSGTTLAPPLGIGQYQQQSDAAAQQHHLLIQAAPPHSGTLVSVVSGTTNTSVPEFLFQLTRMLTENNQEVIEWSNGTYRMYACLSNKLHS
jgi:hypothetical protein